MLGERIAELRKVKGISQEELADILSTSRQAISKWERGESDPDISRLKDLAVYFNVSIDYLLGYDIEATSVNNFIKRVRMCRENEEYSISLDEVKMVVSRNNNNLNLILAAIDYLSDYYYLKRDKEILDVIIQYVQKAILIFQPNNIYDASLNDLHLVIAAVYLLNGEYELVKKYLKENQVIKSEQLLSRCELELGNYEEVEKISFDVFLSSIGSLIESNANQVRVFIRTNRVKEALELCDWSINFTKSVGKNEENFINIVFIFTVIKAYCEKNLGLDYSSSLAYLKENREKTSGFNYVNDGFKFYNNQHQRFVFASESGDIKNDIFNEVSELKKLKVRGYQHALELFKEVYGE